MSTLAPITHSLTNTGARILAFNLDATPRHHDLESFVSLTHWRIEMLNTLTNEWTWFVEDNFVNPDQAIKWARETFSYKTIEGVRLVSPDGNCFGFNKLGECSLENHRSSFDFDHINTMWESDDWDLREQDVFTPSLARSLTRSSDSNTRYKPISLARRHANAIHSLVTRFSSSLAHSLAFLPSLAHYKRVGGIHFIRIGRWSISASKKRKSQVKRDIEERLLRLLAYLVIWPALCITVILLMEAIGFTGR